MAGTKSIQTLTLRPGKADSTYYRHPWIFSRALVPPAHAPDEGALVRVADSRGQVVGHGTWSSRATIAVRLLTFGDTPVDEAWLAGALSAAQARRERLGYGPGTETTGYRVVHGEADGLPGLVVDRYGDTLVCQLATAGMDALRAVLTGLLLELFRPVALVERSDVVSRKDEGLAPVTEFLHGADTGPARFSEHGLAFAADVAGGQKTGFFLDQKDLRQLIRRHAAGRRVLNLFSYTGAAAVAALAGGAVSVHNVDASQPALDQCADQLAANGLDPAKLTSERADVFQWLGAAENGPWDMVLMDPPAVIKTRKDLAQGRKAYHFLNRAAMRLTAPGGVFCTSSCSHFLPWDDLAHILRRASVQNNRHLHLLHRTGQSPDHPVSVYFPESEYLKSAVAVVE